MRNLKRSERETKVEIETGKEAETETEAEKDESLLTEINIGRVQMTHTGGTPQIGTDTDRFPQTDRDIDRTLQIGVNTGRTPQTGKDSDKTHQT